MPRKHSRTLPDLFADPFRERVAWKQEHLQLLGARFEFESNSRELLGLVRSAYAGLPPHRLSRPAPRLRVGLHLMCPRMRGLPPQLEMFSGATFLGGATPASSFVVLSAEQRAALVGVAPQMLRYPYHTRYELLEFAVFTLAARVQGLVPLHAACVGRGDRGVLLMGSSGSGKSTVALHCLLQGMDFVSEDSVFVSPESLRATGIANYLHVRAESLRWLARSSEAAAAIRRSPVIRRRSGARKFEVDLRRGSHRLARSPLKIVAVIFLSAQSAGARPLLTPLSKRRLLAELAAAQPYAAHQPQWTVFQQSLSRIGAFELRRGSHPGEAVEALRRVLEPGSR